MGFEHRSGFEPATVNFSFGLVGAEQLPRFTGAPLSEAMVNAFDMCVGPSGRCYIPNTPNPTRIETSYKPTGELVRSIVQEGRADEAGSYVCFAVNLIERDGVVGYEKHAAVEMRTPSGEVVIVHQPMPGSEGVMPCDETDRDLFVHAVHAFGLSQAA